MIHTPERGQQFMGHGRVEDFEHLIVSGKLCIFFNVTHISAEQHLTLLVVEK
jgi:hypothetical protein